MDVIAITSRKLCSDFLCQLEKIAAAKPKYIVLREKDLTEDEYYLLALDVLKICKKYTVPLICNTYFNVAEKIGADGIHLPLSVALSGGCNSPNILGISTHSVDDALKAQSLGADYITYGHIFATDCKKGLAPRGVNKLAEVCSAVNIPVYAIGGITPKNAVSTTNAGAKGVCLMSSLMTDINPIKLINQIK